MARRGANTKKTEEKTEEREFCYTKFKNHIKIITVIMGLITAIYLSVIMLPVQVGKYVEPNMICEKNYSTIGEDRTRPCNNPDYWNVGTIKLMIYIGTPIVCILALSLLGAHLYDLYWIPKKECDEK